MLSKSDLQSYLQCPRKLWLERHHPELADADDSSSRRRELDGNLVGAKARTQLGEGFIWLPAHDDPASAADEAKALLRQSPHLSATEVPMAHAGLYARADALVRDADGYILRETKASSFPLKADKTTSGKPKKHHLDDVAIQAWIMAESGLSLTRSELNLLNSRWRYPGNGDYTGLFRQMDVTAAIASRVAKVPSWVAAAEKTLQGELPETQTGKQCHDPYECPFQGHCRTLDAPAPAHPIELLPDTAGKRLAKRLREAKGYVSILEPDPAELIGKDAELYCRIRAAHRTGASILEPGSVALMNAIPYPRYFLDFEGIDLAVPRWAGVRPYEQIPFQWSCHIERAPGVFEHAEFLDLSGDDPSLPCIEHLREVIDPVEDGPIFVYSATYERGRLNELADRHPAHVELLRKFADRLVDLLPIVREHFYHPAMQGSFSIKKVLPVVAPDLDYATLVGVQEGTAAQVAYIDAALDPETSPARKAVIGQQLRTYCRQDTWAMVEIAYFLAQAGRPPRPAGM
jgi:CRISPR/Cas system-associated exonuclease Cas4 (RecB family)